MSGRLSARAFSVSDRGPHKPVEGKTAGIVGEGRERQRQPVVILVLELDSFTAACRVEDCQVIEPVVID
jgi:hypothetical protein